MSSTSTNKNKDSSECVCPTEDPNICFVEASHTDKEYSYTMKDMSNSVWKHVRPPIHFGTNQPQVSARKIDVTRAHLTGKLAPRRPEPPLNKPSYPACMRKNVFNDDD